MINHYWAAKASPGHHQGTPKSTEPRCTIQEFVTQLPAQKGFDGSVNIINNQKKLLSDHRCEGRCKINWTESLLKS